MNEVQRRCVIADDVRAWRELLSAWLDECGYDRVLVGDGEAAKESLEVGAIDLVITDIEMPKCSGLELLTRIRNHRLPKIKQIPVMVISSLHDDELGKVVQRFGGNCVFIKPLERQRIQEAVNQLERGESVITQQMRGLENQSPLSKTISPKLRRLAEEALINCSLSF
jgi:CheY-like chemotaxis protein